MKQKVYIWPSMCGLFHTKESIEKKGIKNAKELFAYYLERQMTRKDRETKYLDWCLKHRKDAYKIAQEVWSLRTDEKPKIKEDYEFRVQQLLDEIDP